MRQSPQFNEGDLVRRKEAPDVVGQILRSVWNQQLEEWFVSVRFGTAKKTLPQSSIELVPHEHDIWDDLAQGRCSGSEAFQGRMTLHRLIKPPTRVAGAFGTAKALFLPFQFKPLLKFLEHPGQRLLIADDVGLGKTIEAGYVLREAQSRHRLDTVLIVVPARLRHKWRDELRRRFDEPFETIDRSTFEREFIKRIIRGERPPEFHWIISYESVRDLRFIETLNEVQPPLDFVILDEAHRVRNPQTLQFKIASALASCADAMLFLTATPIQTGLENLYNLLHLLDPSTYSSYPVFVEQIQGNRPVTAALAALRQRAPDLELAASQLTRLRNTPSARRMTEGDHFDDILDRLSASVTPSRETLIQLQRDISELSVTSAIISRTRKADVIPNRPQRRAQTVRVQYTDQERRFYDAVGELCAALSASTSTWGQAMAALMAYRQTASSIPAAVQYFQERIRGKATTYSDDDSSDHDGPNVTMYEQLAEIVARLAPPASIDSKFECFWQALQHTWSEQPDREQQRKVLVFSFFKRTLAHLSRQLAERGVAHGLISGDIPIDEREQIIQQFNTDPNLPVLLSSEVGSEGLDLQSASVVVNYDLPWNPMVVEQRIGRLDRIGQTSSVISILNLIAEGTVEERILLRLYDRLGVFTETLGEIEPILGDTIDKLALDFLSGRLTEDEEEASILQAADALVHQRHEATTLDREADSLIAADQAFLDEIEGLIESRRVPSPMELYRFLRAFVRRRYPGSKIPEQCVAGAGTVVLQRRMAMDLMNTFRGSLEADRVADRIRSGSFPATFDPTLITKYPNAELLFLRHPIMKFALEATQRDQEWSHYVFSLAAPGHDSIASGEYIFSIYQMSLSGFRPRHEIIPVFYRLGDDDVLSEDSSQTLFVHILDHARDTEPVIHVPDEILEPARDQIESAMNELRANWTKRETALNQTRAARRQATMETTLQARLDAAERRLSSLADREPGSFPVRMAEAKLAKEKQRMDDFLDSIKPEDLCRIEDEQIALGVLRVGG